MNQEPTVGVVIPVLNEAERLAHILTQVSRHNFLEIIVVDGGSRDGSDSIVNNLAQTRTNIRGINSDTGRADQMNAGARLLSTDVICFLHADTILPDNALELIRDAIRSNVRWGRFDVRFAEPRWFLRMIAWSMNWRSAFTGVCTGDQCIWLMRELFMKIGGYADIPLMEDIEICKRLKKFAHPHRIKTPVTTSARRWLKHGILRTVLLMWWLRFLYWIGVSPERLAAKYW